MRTLRTLGKSDPFTAVAWVLVLLCTATFAPARVKVSAGAPAATTVVCPTRALEAPWTGTDTVSCAVSTDEPLAAEVLFACEAPAGIACTVEPARLQPRAGEDARVTVRVTYAETLAPGRSMIKIVAQQSTSTATTELAVTKDINTVSARCPDAAEIQTINRDLRLVFTSDPTRGTTGCTKAEGSQDLTIMQSRVYRALATMKRLTFSERLPWTRDSAYRWLTRAVSGIHFRADVQNTNCCSRDGLINIRAVVIRGPTGVIQQGFALAITESRQMPTDFRMVAGFLQLLVHEARHADGKLHTCNGTRDRTYQEMGGYGAAHAFLTWIATRMAPGFVPDDLKARLESQAAALCRATICQGC